MLGCRGRNVEGSGAPAGGRNTRGKSGAWQQTWDSQGRLGAFSAPDYTRFHLGAAHPWGFTAPGGRDSLVTQLLISRLGEAGVTTLQLNQRHGETEEEETSRQKKKHLQYLKAVLFIPTAYIVLSNHLQHKTRLRKERMV